MPGSNDEHRYGPTSGTATGWVGLLVCGGFAVDVVVDGVDLAHLRWLLAIAAIAVLLWALMLRPVIIVRPQEHLVLRNPFSSWLVPIAAVTAVSVRALTRIRVGEATYDGVAVGRRIRSMVSGRTPRASRRADASTPEALADLMTEQILALAADARGRGQDAGAVRRVWAVPELASLGVLLVALVVTLVL